MFECPVEGCDSKFKTKLARDGHVRMSNDEDHVKYRQKKISKTDEKVEEEKTKEHPTEEIHVQTKTKPKPIGAKDAILSVIQQGKAALKSKDILDEEREMIENMILELQTSLKDEGQRKDNSKNENEKLRSIIKKWQEWNRHIKRAWVPPEKHKEIIEKERINAFELGRQQMLSTIAIQKRQIEEFERKNYELNQKNLSLRGELTGLQDTISRIVRLKRRDSGFSLQDYQKKYLKKDGETIGGSI